MAACTLAAIRRLGAAMTEEGNSWDRGPDGEYSLLYFNVMAAKAAIHAKVRGRVTRP